MTKEVLTLEELADYLRLPRTTVEREALHGRIPGQRIEDNWRFLKDAINDWLRAHDNRTLMLQQAGALAGDEDLPALRSAIYKSRGRAEAPQARG